MPNARNVTHVRIRPETLDQLSELAAQMEESVSLGRGKRFWKREALTSAELIAELVRRELDHRRRSRESSERKRGKGRKGHEDAQPATDDGGVNAPDEVLDLGVMDKEERQEVLAAFARERERAE